MTKLKKYFIGVDLGGTKITTAIGDMAGNIIEKTTLATGAKEGEDLVMSRIIESINMVLEASNLPLEEVKAIGIGAPGPLDSISGSIITTPNLPFKNYSITKPLMEKFGIPAYLDNDANVAAIGEWMFGAGVGYKNVLYITVSTGVGGGAVLNGRPYSGTTNNALEIGHMTIEPFSKYRCNCGNFGDVESLCSGTAISKRAKEAIENGEETILTRMDSITSYEVHQAYLEGDEVAKRILFDAFEYLGIAVANLILAFDPQIIAIGGGVSKIGKLMFDKVRESAKKRCFDFMVDKVKIVPTGLAQDTGVIGALSLAMVMSEDK